VVYKAALELQLNLLNCRDNVDDNDISEKDKINVNVTQGKDRK
jgi:hypothetical protein